MGVNPVQAGVAAYPDEQSPDHVGINGIPAAELPEKRPARTGNPENMGILTQEVMKQGDHADYAAAGMFGTVDGNAFGGKNHISRLQAGHFTASQPGVQHKMEDTEVAQIIGNMAVKDSVHGLYFLNRQRQDLVIVRFGHPDIVRQALAAEPVLVAPV